MRWTRDIAPKTFNSMIACGVKILVLMLLMSIISKLVPIWATEAATWKIDDWSPLWRVAFSAAGCAFLAWKAPQIAANAISGTSSLTAGDALQIATMAATAAVATTAVASGAADKVLEKASGAASRGFDSLRNSVGSSSISPLAGSSSVPNQTGPDVSKNDGSYPSNSNNPKKGNAKNASIGGSEADKKIDKHFSDKANNNPPKKLSEKMQDGLRTFQSSIPNDQATVGGDAVKLKE
jgi:type IV secretion system protein TrbL